MPAYCFHIPSAAITNKWLHLPRITNYFMPVSDDVEIGLLLGYRCYNALVPPDVIFVETGGSYALLTELGLSIV